jgi:hypothetical protein
MTFYDPGITTNKQARNLIALQISVKVFHMEHRENPNKDAGAGHSGFCEKTISLYFENIVLRLYFSILLHCIVQ